MNIALINLPLDNNYGGNLQRFALVKVLQVLGHDVTHISLRFCFDVPLREKFISTTKSVVKTILNKHANFFYWKKADKRYQQSLAHIKPFYDRYIPHTSSIFNLQDFHEWHKYDAVIVGSDQVWRKNIADRHLSSFFLDFLQEETVKKIAYGVSFGSAENELLENEKSKLGALYARFHAVSVRERSGIDLIRQYGWKGFQPTRVLDPTLLLDKQQYITLTKDGDTLPSAGDLFCYILDMDDEKTKLIHATEQQYNLKAFLYGLGGHTTIEQWLRSFLDAKMILTDSYHGLVFSIIFNKPFILIRNKFRGNARFDNIVEMFSINEHTPYQNWEGINSILEVERRHSLQFLADSLSE